MTVLDRTHTDFPESRSPGITAAVQGAQSHMLGGYLGEIGGITVADCGALKDCFPLIIDFVFEDKLFYLFVGALVDHHSANRSGFAKIEFDPSLINAEVYCPTRARVVIHGHLRPQSFGVPFPNGRSSGFFDGSHGPKGANVHALSAVDGRDCCLHLVEARLRDVDLVSHPARRHTLLKEQLLAAVVGIEDRYLRFSSPNGDATSFKVARPFHVNSARWHHDRLSRLGSGRARSTSF